MTIYRPLEDAGWNPSALAANSDSGVSLGIEFTLDSGPAWLTEIRWYQSATGSPSSVSRTAGLYSVNVSTEVGTLLGSVTGSPSGTGWQSMVLATPVALSTGVTYRAAVYHPAGGYVAQANYFSSGGGASDIVDGPVRVPNATHALNAHQGSFHYSGALALPDGAFNAANYGTGVTITNIDPSGSTTPVSSDSDIRWIVRNAVTSDSDLRWAVRGRVISDADLRWAIISASVTSDLDVRWAVRSPVISDADLRWTVRGVLTSDIDVRWAVRNSVLSDADIRWGVLGPVTSDADLRWAVRAALDSDIDVRWVVLHPPGRDVQVVAVLADQGRIGALLSDQGRITATLGEHDG